MKPNRPPRWAKWLLMPEVRVWEAVALSLNIEPEQIKVNRFSEMGAKHPFNEGSKFDDRLDVTCANLMDNRYFPTLGALSLEGKYKCGVSLKDFVSFANSVFWKIPPELASLKRLAGASIGTEFSSSPSPLTKIEQQIQAIEVVANQLFNNRFAVPDGGKQEIMVECQKRYRELFGVSEHPFDNAWKEARKQERVRMANHHKFVR